MCKHGRWVYKRGQVAGPGSAHKIKYEKQLNLRWERITLHTLSFILQLSSTVQFCYGGQSNQFWMSLHKSSYYSLILRVCPPLPFCLSTTLAFTEFLRPAMVLAATEPLHISFLVSYLEIVPTYLLDLSLSINQFLWEAFPCDSNTNQILWVYLFRTGCFSFRAVASLCCWPV